MEAKIKIAHIIGKLSAGGVEAVVFNYCRHIPENVQFDIFYDADSTVEPPEDLVEKGVQFYKIPPYQKPFAYIPTLTQLFLKGNYPIVHSHMNTLSVFPLFAAWLAHVPVRIAHSHSTIGKGEKINWIKMVLRPFSKIFPTHYCACSKYAGEWLFGKKFFATGKVRVINNAIDLSRFIFCQTVRDKVRAELGVQDKFVIGHVGRFNYQKNHAFLIEIFAEIVKKQPNAVLLLVGQGPEQENVEQQVQVLGIAQSVKILGVRSDVNNLMQAMDVFLLPSRYEGLPVVGVEAQVADLPCVLSDAMTAETKVLDTATFLSLNDAPEVWADKVLSFENHARTDTSETLKARGYDIRHEAELLCEYYLALVRE